MAYTTTHIPLPHNEHIYLQYLLKYHGLESQELADRICLLMHNGWLPSVIALSLSMFSSRMSAKVAEYTQYKLPDVNKKEQPQSAENPIEVTSEMLKSQDPPLPRGGYKMYYSDKQIYAMRAIAKLARKTTATTLHGTKYYQATLKMDLLIQDAIRRGLSRSEIGRLFGVSKVTITLRMRHYDQEKLKEFEREGAELRARRAIPGKGGVPYPHQKNREQRSESADNGQASESV